MLKLKEAMQRGDSNQIISSLIKLRDLSKGNEIDRTTFGLLLDLIKIPNPKILNYALSILANCCLNNNYRAIFKEMGGVPHVLLVVKTIESDSITCRACRLIGNLASNADLAEELCENNGVLILIDLLNKHQNMSTDTLNMIFRALKKLWTVAEYKWKVLPEGCLSAFNEFLCADNVKFVQQTLDLLVIVTQLKYCSKNAEPKVNKELFLKVIELSKKDEFNHLALLCLSNFVCYQTSCIWPHLEGSNIADVFIAYIEKFNKIEGGVLNAFQKLCTEVAVRNKVKIAGLLPRLIKMINSTNIKTVINIFYLFQYDLPSMVTCSKDSNFAQILINNLHLPGAISLLTVLSRLNPPVKELILKDNLDIIIKNEKCREILRNITRTREFLRPLLISGKVWEIDKAGCSMEDIGCLETSEGLIIHLLGCDDRKFEEEVSLAIPFLVKPRNFELLFKLLVRNQVITTILRSLQKNPAEEKILASIIRLINIFKFNYHQTDSFFQDFQASGDVAVYWDSENYQVCTINEHVPTLETSTSLTIQPENVTFELDDGSCVNMNKELLCKNSPVLDSMLNGHFIEARQEKVKLRECSTDALLFLEKLLSGSADLMDIKIETYLELLSLTDRFLLTSLNDLLSENLKINKQTCLLIYQWYRKAGYTKNNAGIRKKTYEFIFSSTEYLVLAMRNEWCRVSLLNEISNYLSNSLVDLL